jgi:signal peptidase I
LSFVAAMLAARSALADHYTVPSGSMEPTVEVDDRIIAFKAAYGLRLPWTELWVAGPSMPSRGDVIVLRSPETGDVLLKRVVAIAGDEIAVRGGRLWLDGRAVAMDGVDPAREHLGRRPHAVRLEAGGGPELSPRRVPVGQLLVMGDNRGNSRDGRSFGFVPAEAVLGRALAVFQRDGSFRWLSL